MLRGVRASARVLLHDHEVGTIAFRSGGAEFDYTDDLRDPRHQVLGQVFEEAPRASYRETTGLPAWFANLLPEEGSGLRRYYAARYGERAVDDARLLLSLGADLPGAVVVEPIDVPDEGVLIESRPARQDGTGVHLSALAGAQLKMSLIRDGDRLTVPTRGESGEWIAKFADTVHRDLAENEHLMMCWAAAAGLDAAHSELVRAASVPDEFDRHLPADTPVYLVRRFDRGPAGARTQIEDLAQVQGTPPALRAHRGDYDTIGRYLRVAVGGEAFDEYVRRLVAMVLMANEDAHLKNWSLWYPDGRTPALAPAYDLVCTSYYANLQRGLVFPLGGTRQTDAIGLDEFRTLGEAARAPETLDVVHETVHGLLAGWEQVRDRELCADLVDHIDRRLRVHPLVAQTR